jgi:hypothetical protein
MSVVHQVQRLAQVALELVSSTSPMPCFEQGSLAVVQPVGVMVRRAAVLEQGPEQVLEQVLGQEQKGRVAFVEVSGIHHSWQRLLHGTFVRFQGLLLVQGLELIRSNGQDGLVGIESSLST